MNLKTPIGSVREPSSIVFCGIEAKKKCSPIWSPQYTILEAGATP